MPLRGSSNEALALSRSAYEAASKSNEGRQKECEELRQMKDNAEAQAVATMDALAQAGKMLAARTEAVAKAQAEVATATGLLRCAESFMKTAMGLRQITPLQGSIAERVAALSAMLDTIKKHATAPK